MLINIANFKGLDLRSLYYWIRVCQKNHNEVTMTLNSYYEIACIKVGNKWVMTSEPLEGYCQG